MSSDAIPPPGAPGPVPADAPTAPPASPPTPPPRAASPPPPPPPAASPPPPPPGPTFDAAGQARALFSQMDSTGYKPTGIVAAIILAMFFGAQIVNGMIPVSAVGPGVLGPGGPGPTGPGPIPTLGPLPTTGPGPLPTTGPGGPVTTPLPPGSTLTVGPLRIPLENGWVPQEVPGSNIIVRLVKGNAVIDVFSASIQGQADAAAVYEAYISNMQQDSTGLAATQPNLIQIGNGIPAARGSYTGVFGQSQVEGEVTTMVVGNTEGFIFDVWGGSGTLRPLLPEAERMIDNLQVQ